MALTLCPLIYHHIPPPLLLCPRETKPLPVSPAAAARRQVRGSKHEVDALQTRVVGAEDAVRALGMQFGYYYSNNTQTKPGCSEIDLTMNKK